MKIVKTVFTPIKVTLLILVGIVYRFMAHFVD
jgi:hypothetical protein